MAKADESRQAQFEAPYAILRRGKVFFFTSWLTSH